ncbi:MAG: hypothetical protein L0271_24255 [Gemmatimonadetes bacterium]|nr:hypothetical protein [Gemmatimonadota bacterium]
MRHTRLFRTTGIVLLTLGAVVGVGILIVRDQITRHRRNLFSAVARQRLAALGYIARLDASIDLVQLLRDYVAWEQRVLLRRRAQQILGRMERELDEVAGQRAGIAG